MNKNSTSTPGVSLLKVAAPSRDTIGFYIDEVPAWTKNLHLGV